MATIILEEILPTILAKMLMKMKRTTAIQSLLVHPQHHHHKDDQKDSTSQVKTLRQG